MSGSALPRGPRAWLLRRSNWSRCRLTLPSIRSQTNVPIANHARSALLLASISLALLAASSGSVGAARLKVEGLDVVTHQGVRHFTVEVADTEASRDRGLMFRKSLAADRGMLFDFHTPQPVAFWMNNTLIPLDML